MSGPLFSTENAPVGADPDGRSRPEPARKAGRNNVTVADLNGGLGAPDLVLGNLGLNSYLRASSSEPARLYVGDSMLITGRRSSRFLTFYSTRRELPDCGAGRELIS